MPTPDYIKLKQINENLQKMQEGENGGRNEFRVLKIRQFTAASDA